MEPQWERLGQYVAARRRSRGWSQDDVIARGGPSDSLQTEIEALRWKPTRSVRGTLVKIDKGMEWEPGSASLILAGGEPTDEGSGAITPSPSHTSDGARHLLNHTWGIVEQFADELVNAGPPESLRHAAGRVLGIVGEYLADHIINYDMHSGDRDRVLADLYRRREAVERTVAHAGSDDPKGPPFRFRDTQGGTGQDRANEGH